jgi:predicted amidophosphoribosyltransferase
MLELGRAAYMFGKAALDAGDFRRACQAFQLAAHLPGALVAPQRLKILREVAAIRANSVLWRASLIEMQRTLAMVCHEQRCECNSHFEIARCRGLIGNGLHHVLGSVEVHTVDGYHPYNPAHPWTKLLRRIKAGHEVDLLASVTDILADFLFETTDVLRYVDIIVPVPPSTEKFVNRGFAPNDVVAAGLTTRLALPSMQVLVRSAGPPTREATDEELSKQFGVSNKLNLKGLTVLLVEDIWTWGRTIPICAAKLSEHGAVGVYAAALGKTVG